MNIKSLLLGSAAALAVVSGAQAADAVVAAEPEPMEYVRVCDAFGTGYFYIPGTETCLKIGGYIRVEWRGGDVLGQNTFPGGGGDSWQTRTRATLKLSTATDTEYGALKTYAEVEFQKDNNNGGSTNWSHPLLLGLIGDRKINRRGRLFVVIGRRTFSAAQNTTTYFERYTNAIFVGEPTGSSPNFVGEEVPVTLPYSKVWANVSHLFWQSAWPQDQRMWLAPQIYTPPTFADFRAGRDAALETILNYRAP